MSKCNMYCVPRGDELATNKDADAETAYITFAQAVRACQPKRIEKYGTPRVLRFNLFSTRLTNAAQSTLKLPRCKYPITQMRPGPAWLTRSNVEDLFFSFLVSAGAVH